MSAQSNKELGYFSDGEPTDAQLILQDKIDNCISLFLEEMTNIYRCATPDENIADWEWDIKKITEIREEAEKQLELPEVY